MSAITLKVNGVARRVPVEDTTLLLDALRQRVGTTSTREGCGVGACGACTVLADGMSVSSCLALAVRYIPGFVLMTKELLAENPNPTDEEITDHLEGNICRCATYPEIRTAVRLAAQRSGR